MLFALWTPVLSAGGGPLPGPEKLASFETGFPDGWYVFQGASTVTPTALVASAATSLARPAQTGDNAVLKVDFNIADFGGLGAGFVSGGPRYWANTDGISFWFRGTGSGLVYQFEISDNRSDPGKDTSERFDADFTDNSSEWRRISILWQDFSRAVDFQPAGAPDDGLTLTEVWGWAVVLPVTSGFETVHFDDIGFVPATIADFESPLETGSELGTGLALGFTTFADPASSITMSRQATPPAAESFEFGTPNQVLEIAASVSVFAGVAETFANPEFDSWTSRDWRFWEGIGFWIYGQDSGAELFFDIFENRNPGSTTDDAERWTVSFSDTTSGWTYYEFPFASFTRKNIGNGAPNDGLTLDEVHGWALGFVAGPSDTWLLDGVSLTGTAAALPSPELAFSDLVVPVAEGDDAIVAVRLSGLPADGAAGTVTAAYETEPAEAVAGRDFVATAGTLVFEPGGPTTQTIVIPTLDDDDYEGSEGLKVRLRDASGVNLGSNARSAVIINDVADFDPIMLDDFVRFPYRWMASPSLVMENPEISPAPDGGVGPEGVLEVAPPTTGPEGSFGLELPMAEDWSGSPSLGFWYSGQGGGDSIVVRVMDNRAADPGPFGWELTWSDEFNDPPGSPPDPDNWTLDIGDGLTSGLIGWGDGELQTYTDDPANVAADGNGNLRITVTAADGSSLCWYGPCQYSSARVKSRRRVELGYGKIESRIRVAAGHGLRSAFWGLGKDLDRNPWPAVGEIDIMENVGRAPKEIYGSIHGPGYSGGNAFGNVLVLVEPASDAFHLFTIEWQPDRIDWFVDGNFFHTAARADLSPNEWVFNDPLFLLVNLAVGGNFAGPVGGAVEFPQSLLVDYVRVYQAPDSAERFEASFADDTVGWRWIELPFSSFVRATEQPLFAPDDGFGLTEVWGVEVSVPATIAGPIRFDEFKKDGGLIFADAFESPWR